MMNDKNPIRFLFIVNCDSTDSFNFFTIAI